MFSYISLKMPKDYKIIPKRCVSIRIIPESVIIISIISDTIILRYYYLGK